LNDASDEKKTIGYLNPANICLSALNPVVNRRSKEYKNKTEDQLNVIKRKKIRDARMAAAIYIGKCMVN
jgi:hypothetical protein